MARPVSPRCPNCNAPIVLHEGRSLYTCTFCNASIDVGGRTAPRPVYVPEGRQAHARMSSTSWVVVGVVSLGVLTLGFIVLMSSIAPPRTGTAFTVSSRAPREAPPNAEPRFQWESEGPLFIVDLNGDGVEDIIGRTRAVLGEVKTHVTAFDGKTFRRLWNLGPLPGTFGDIFSQVLLALQGTRLVITQTTDEAWVVDARTGEKTATVTLSDAAQSICADPQGNDVFIALTDTTNVLLDVKSGLAKPVTAPPRGCAGKPPEPSPRVPPQEHFEVRRTFATPAGLLVVGNRSPGTAVPLLALFAEGQSTPRWSRPLAEVSASNVAAEETRGMAVEGNFVYALYPVKTGGTRLVKRSLATGDALFDVAVPRSTDGSGPSRLFVQHGRIYVPHWTYLDIFDAENGNVLTTLGRW